MSDLPTPEQTSRANNVIKAYETYNCSVYEGFEAKMANQMMDEPPKADVVTYLITIGPSRIWAPTARSMASTWQMWCQNHHKDTQTVRKECCDNYIEEKATEQVLEIVKEIERDLKFARTPIDLEVLCELYEACHKTLSYMKHKMGHVIEKKFIEAESNAFLNREPKVESSEEFAEKDKTSLPVATEELSEYKTEADASNWALVNWATTYQTWLFGISECPRSPELAT